MNISDRAEAIVAQFCRNYFGHVDPKFGGDGGWKDIEDLVIRLDESLDHPRKKIGPECKQKVRPDYNTRPYKIIHHLSQVLDLKKMDVIHEKIMRCCLD